MPASVYEPISTVLKNSFYGPKSSGLGSKLDSSLQKSLLVPVSVLCELLLWHYFLKLSIPQVQYDDAVRQTPNLSEKQKSKYIILTASNPAAGKSSSEPQSASPKAVSAGAKLDQVPDPRVTLFRRDQVELGYRGPMGPGSGMFNMGNTCYLNSTLQVHQLTN